MPDSNVERNPIDRLAEEFAERLRHGERPALTEYVRKYPELADEIRELFPALVMMEQFKPTSLDSSDAASRRPDRIGDYRLLREIGRGGMGVVYEAEQLSLGRHVALKVLHDDSLTNPTYLERFRREAKAAARLHHTNIVPVFGVGEGDGVHYYAMQFIHGESLDKVLRDLRRLRSGAGQGVASDVTVDAFASRSVAQNLLSDRFELAEADATTSASAVEFAPPSSSGTLSGAESEAEYCRSVTRVGLQVAEALAYAHKQGILHRDIKPSNLLLDLQGTVWVTDFGLAKVEDADELTHTGDIVGTLRYMAPERFEGASLPRSDVYALGMTLYEMLTLRPAFGETNRAKLIQRILHDDPPAPRKLDPRIPRDLETVVLKAIAHDPARRYATAGDLAEDLRRFLADRPVRARRSRLPERFWRWCRRNPAVASLTAVIALLLLLVAVGSTLSAWSLRAAEKDARAKLWRSKLSEARAKVLSRMPGQRFTSLKRVREALAIAKELGLSDDDRLNLRNAAIAALALPDFEVVEEGDRAGLENIDFRPAHYAIVERSGRISVRRVRDDREIAALPAMDREVSLCLSPDGRYLAVCPNTDWVNGTLQLWRIDQTEPRCVHEGISLCSPYADFSPDGDWLVYESVNCLTVVELASGRVQTWPLPGIRCLGGGVRCRPGGRDVAVNRVVNGKGVVEVRELATGAIRTKLWHDGSSSSLDWHPSGRFLALACGFIISLWDVEAERQVRTFEGHKQGGVSGRFNRTGDRLMSADWGGSLRFWDAGSGRQLRGFSVPSIPVAFSPDDQYLAYAIPVAGDVKLRFLRSAAGREVRTLAPFSASGTVQYRRPPTFSGDGRLVAVSAADPLLPRRQGLSLLDWPSGRELGRLSAHDLSPLGFAPDGALWTGRGSSTVLRWPRSTNAATGAIRLGPPERVVSIPRTEACALSSDGQDLVLANFNQGAFLLRGGPSGQLVPTGSHYDVRYAAVSPDGRWVASGSHWWDSGAAAKVWDARTGRLLKEFAVASACPVGFSPDGRWLVTGGGGARLWRAGTWEEGPRLLDEGVAWLWTFSPDGRLLALGGQGCVHLVRPDSGAELARLALPEQTYFSPLCFSPSGTALLVQGEDTGVIHVWDLPRIRRQLTEMGLDWEDPPLPDDSSPSHIVPRAVEFVGVELAIDPQQMRQYELFLVALGLRANPFDARAHARIGHLLESADPKAAFAHYSAALAFGPDQQLVAEQRAVLGYRLKNWCQTVADASQVLEQYPYRDRSRYFRARAYQHLGQHANAVADFTAVIPHFSHDGRLHQWRADSYQALGEKTKAEADRRKAREIAPEDARQLDERAWRLITGPLAERDPPAALKIAQKAVDLVPHEAAYLNTLGVAQYRNRLYSEAIVTLEKSLALSDGRSDAYDLFFLAMCHQQLGDPVRARDCFDRAVLWWREQKDLSPQEIQELNAFQAEAEECLKSNRQDPAGRVGRERGDARRS
jgi:serine/threonine protein kinase/WD40 repeat protein/tetratricopeptide (TPR) repeat protein